MNQSYQAFAGRLFIYNSAIMRNTCGQEDDLSLPSPHPSSRLVCLEDPGPVSRASDEILPASSNHDDNLQQ